MDLEQRAIEIRPRTQWEACDLGVQMGRHWWWPQMKIGLMLALPWCVICWLLPAHFTLLPLVFFWLGKPLWERFLLHFLSQAIFNINLRVFDVIKFIRVLLTQDWLASILWRRLSPWRAYHCALTVLEAQTGNARRQRLGHLAGSHASAAAMVTLLLFCFEWCLLLSVWLIGMALTPAQFNWDITHLNEFFGSGIVAALFATVYFVIYAAVAPFYVSINFALYLNRRIWLEAWDIDISFKALAKRLAHRLSIVVLCGGLWLMGTTAPCVMASEYSTNTSNTLGTAPSDTQPSHQDELDEIAQALAKLSKPLQLCPELKPRPEIVANFPAEQRQIEQLLAGKDFHQKKTTLKHHWRWKLTGTKKPADLRDWEEIIAMAAKVLEVLIWGFALFLIFWLALNFRSLNERFGRSAVRRKTSPTSLQAFGLDLRPANLPDRVDEAALRYCQAGDYRQGLALLYRATLVALVQKGLSIKASDTEEDCIAQAGAIHLQLPPASLNYLRELTAQWQNLAYGHQTPASALAVDLCTRWSAHWQEAVAARV